MTQNEKRKQRIERIVENNNRIREQIEDMEYHLVKIDANSNQSERIYVDLLESLCYARRSISVMIKNIVYIEMIMGEIEEKEEEKMGE